MTRHLQRIAARGAGLSQAAIKPTAFSAWAQPGVPTVLGPYATAMPTEPEPMPIAAAAPVGPAQVAGAHSVPPTNPVAVRETREDGARSAPSPHSTFTAHDSAPALPTMRPGLPVMEQHETVTRIAHHVAPEPTSPSKVEPAAAAQPSRVEIRQPVAAPVEPPANSTWTADDIERSAARVTAPPVGLERSALEPRAAKQSVTLRVTGAQERIVQLAPTPPDERPLPPLRPALASAQPPGQTRTLAQDLRVSIGRIEVHVEAERAPAPVAPAPSSEPPFASMRLERSGWRSSF